MMSREHHRRRSPESSRRRRKERRDSREQLQSHPIPAPIPLYGDMSSQSHQQPFQPPYQQSFQDSYSAPYQSPYQHEPPLARDPDRDPDRDRNRDRTLSTSYSSTSSTSSTSSSLVNISQPSKKFGIGSFFSTSARKHRRRVKKKRSKILRFGNSSSSSVGSDLAYGRGYIDRRGSRDFSPPTEQRPSGRDNDPAWPRPPKRAQTDEEIIELGRKFAELARQQNAEDLRAAGRTRPSTFASAATALNQFRRTNSGKSNKGIGNSKPHQDSSSDDSDWESASSDDESSEGDSDNGLAYGSTHHLSSVSGRPSHLGSSHRPTQTYSQGIPLNRKPSLVDPKLFGPVNSLRGFVQTPCGFDRVDRNTVEDTRPHYESSIAPGESVGSAESRPMQYVYPIPTSDPSHFDAGRGSVVSAQQMPSRSRPAPVPIQQPKPIAPVYSKVFDSVETDPKYSSRSSARAAASTGGIGVPAATIKAPLSSDAAIGALLRAARKADEDEIQKPRSDDLQLRLKRGGDKGLQEEYKKHDDREVLPGIAPEKLYGQDLEATHNGKKDRRYREQKQFDPEQDFKREDRRLDNGDPTSDQVASQRGTRKEKSREYQSGVYAPKTDVSVPSQDPGIQRPKDAIDPFQYQVADDAFPTPRHGTPTRPLTPVIMTVEREPDFSKFDNYDPYERLSRKDSFERELQDAQNAYKAAEQATVPTSKAAFAAAAAAEIATRRFKRSTKRDVGSPGHSQDSTSSTRPKDPVLDDADRAYREARIARRIREQEERSRSNSPDSVVDKWKEDRCTATPSQVETPPAMDHPKQKSPFDGPNADVRIDNVLEHPRDLARFRVSESRRRSLTFPMFSARDPSAERERPMLNLVRPTPAPSPMPEKQQLRTIELPSSITEAETTSLPSAKSDEVVSASSVAPSKAVTWGENETKHYIVENSEQEDDLYSGTKIATPAVTPRSPADKKGWATVAAAAFGVGTGIVASSVSNSAVDIGASSDRTESEHSRQLSKRNPSSKFDDLYDEPPIPGPKPSSPRIGQVPGRFAEDPVFMANIAAGLEGSGFDPNIIIDDARFHRRDSPPGSNEPLARHVELGEATDRFSKPTVPQPTESTKSEDHERVVDDSAVAPQERSVSGKDKKKKKKAKRASVADEPEPSTTNTRELSQESSYMMIEPEADSMLALEAQEKGAKVDADDIVPEPVIRDNVLADWDSQREGTRKPSRDSSPSRHAPLDRDTVERSKSFVDSSSSLRNDSAAAVEEEWVDLPKKERKKKKSKRDSTTREQSSVSRSLPRPGDYVEGPEQTLSEVSFTDTALGSAHPKADLVEEGAKRRSAPGGFPEYEDLYVQSPPDRERELSAFTDKQVSNSSGFFGRLKSSMGFSEGKDQPQVQNKEANSFLDNAGALGTSAGLTGSAIALAYQKLTANAAHTTPEAGLQGEAEATERRPNSPDETALIDPEIVEREIRPAIDPTYGDLLPLPPSRSISPVPDLDEAIPPLPESRPGTPEDERERLLLAQKSTHIRRRSETPLRVKTPSQSAIPLQFRLAQRTTPASPGVQKPSPSASPISATQETGSVPRRPRPMSWESTRTFKPLLLVERTSRESVVTPTSLHEEIEPGDIQDEPQHASSPTISHAVTPRDDLHDSSLAREATARSPESPQLPPLQPVEKAESPTTIPDPVDPVSKNRSSYLLYSSPPGHQNSDNTDAPEGSPSLRAAKRHMALGEVKEDTVDDIPEDYLLTTAADGFATEAFVDDVLEDDDIEFLETPPETKNRSILDLIPVGVFSGLGKRGATTEMDTQRKVPSEGVPVAIKKAEEGKSEKDDFREIKSLAKASAVEASADPEVPLSSITLDSSVKMGEEDDAISSMRLSKKGKERSLSLPAQDENTTGPSLPVEDTQDEFFDAPTGRIADELPIEKAESDSLSGSVVIPNNEVAEISVKAPKELSPNSATEADEAAVEAPAQETLVNIAKEIPEFSVELGFQAPAEALTEATLETPVKSPTEVESSTQAVHSDELAITTKKGKKKKKRKSQIQELEAEEKSYLTISEGDAVVPATGEDAIIEGSTSTHEEMGPEIVTSLATPETTKDKTENIAFAQEEATVTPILDATTPNEQRSLDVGQDNSNPVDKTTSEHSFEHVQVLPIEVQDVSHETKEDFADTPPSNAAEEVPAATSIKSKKKKKKKQSQTFAPEQNISAVVDSQSLTNLVGETKQSGNELLPSKLPEEPGAATEAIPPTPTMTVDAASLPIAPTEIIEPCPSATPGELHEQPDPTLKVSQPPSDIMGPTTGEEPSSEEIKFDIHEIEGEARIRTSEPTLMPSEDQRVDTSHPPELSSALEAQLEVNPLPVEEVTQTAKSTEPDERPLAETANEDLHDISPKSLEAAESSKDQQEAADDSQFSPSDRLTGTQPSKPQDEPEEPGGKKKNKKNKKKKQSALDSSDLQETTDTPPKAEDVQDQSMKDQSAVSQVPETLQALQGTDVDPSQAEVPSGDVLPEAGNSALDSKEVTGDEDIAKQLDASSTQQLEEPSRPTEETSEFHSEGAVDSTKSAMPSQPEPTAGASFSEPATPTKKGKKKGKKNRQSADLGALVETVDPSSAVVDTVAQTRTDTMQLGSESSLLVTADGDLPMEKETAEVDPEVEVLNKEKPENDKRRDPTQFDLDNSSETMPETTDTSSAQQDTITIPQPEEVSHIAVEPIVDNARPTSPEVVNATGDVSLSPKKSKKKSKRPSLALAEDDDTSDLPGPIPESVSHFKEASHIPEQVQDDDADVSSTSTYPKKSKKDKKKKRQSVQFVEPIEESRETPKEDTNIFAMPEVTAELKELPLDTSSQVTTPAESATSPVEVSRNLGEDDNGHLFQESTEIPSLGLDSSFVPLPADGDAGTDLLHDVSTHSTPQIVQLEENQMSEQQEHEEAGSAGRGLESEEQKHIDASVPIESQREGDTHKSIEAQVEMMQPDTISNVPVETDSLMVAEDKPPAEAMPVVEESVSATTNNEGSVVSKKSKKEKKKRKGKSQENQESISDATPKAENQKTPEVPSANTTETEQGEPAESKDQALAGETVVDEPRPEERIVGAPIIEEPVNEPAGIDEPATEELIVRETLSEEPISDKTDSDKSIVKEPILEGTIVDRSSVQAPVVGESIDDKLAMESTVDETAPDLATKKSKKSKKKAKKNSKIMEDEPTRISDLTLSSVVDDGATSREYTIDPPQSAAQEGTEDLPKSPNKSILPMGDQEVPLEASSITLPSALTDQSQSGQDNQTENTGMPWVDETTLTEPVASNINAVEPSVLTVPEPAQLLDALVTEAQSEPIVPGKSKKDKKKKKRDSQLSENENTEPVVDVVNPTGIIEQTTAALLPGTPENTVLADCSEPQIQKVDSPLEHEPVSVVPTISIEPESSTNPLMPVEQSSEQPPTDGRVISEVTEKSLAVETEGDKTEQGNPPGEEPFSQKPGEQAVDEHVAVQLSEGSSSTVLPPPAESNGDDTGKSASDKKTKKDKKDKKKKKKKQDTPADEEARLASTEPTQPASDLQEQNDINLSTEPGITITTDVPLKSHDNLVEVTNLDDMSSHTTAEPSNEEKQREKQTSLANVEISSEPQPAPIQSVSADQEETHFDFPQRLEKPLAEELPKIEDTQNIQSPLTETKEEKNATDEGEEMPREEEKELADPKPDETEQPDISNAIPFEAAENSITVAGDSKHLVATHSETIPEASFISKDDDASKAENATVDDDVSQDNSAPGTGDSLHDAGATQSDVVAQAQSGRQDEGASQGQPLESEHTIKEETTLDPESLTHNQPLDDPPPTKKGKKNKKKKKQSVSQIEELSEDIRAKDASSSVTTDVVEPAEDKTPLSASAPHNEVDPIEPGPEMTDISRDDGVSADQLADDLAARADALLTEPLASESSNEIGLTDPAPIENDEKGTSSNELSEEGLAGESAAGTIDASVNDPLIPKSSNEDSPILPTTKNSRKDKKKKKQATSQEDESAQQAPPAEASPKIQEPTVQLELPQEDISQGSSPNDDISKEVQPENEQVQMEVSHTIEDTLSPEESKETELPTEVKRTSSSEPATVIELEAQTRDETIKSDNPPNDEVLDPSPPKKSKKDRKKKKKTSSLDPEAPLRAESSQPEGDQAPEVAESVLQAKSLQEAEAPPGAGPHNVQDGDLVHLTPAEKSKGEKEQPPLEAQSTQDTVERSAEFALIDHPGASQPIEASLPNVSGMAEVMEPSATEDVQLQSSQDPEVSQTSLAEASQNDGLFGTTPSVKSKKSKKKKRANTIEAEPEPKVDSKDEIESSAWPTETLELPEGQNVVLSKEESSMQATDAQGTVSETNKALHHESIANSTVDFDTSAQALDTASRKETSSLKPEEARELTTELKASEAPTETVAGSATEATFPKDQQTTTQVIENEPLEEVALDTAPAIGNLDSPPLQRTETVQLEETTPAVNDETETVPSKKSKKDKKKKKRASQVSWELGPEAEIEDLPEQQQSERTFDEQPTTTDSTDMRDSGKPAEDLFSELKSEKVSKNQRLSQMDWELEPNSGIAIEELKPLPSTEQGQHDDMLLDHQSLAGDTETSLKHSINLDDTFLETASSKKSNKKKKASQPDGDTETPTPVTSASATDQLLVDKTTRDKGLELIDTLSAAAAEPVQFEVSADFLPHEIDSESKIDKHKAKKQSIAKTHDPEPVAKEDPGDLGESTKTSDDIDASEHPFPVQDIPDAFQPPSVPSEQDSAKEKSRDLFADEMQPPVSQPHDDDLSQSLPVMTNITEDGSTNTDTIPPHDKSSDTQNAMIPPSLLEGDFKEIARMSQADEVADRSGSSQDIPQGIPEPPIKTSRKEKRKAKNAQALGVSAAVSSVNPGVNFQSWDWSNIDNKTQPETRVPETVSAQGDLPQTESQAIMQPSHETEVPTQQGQEREPNLDYLGSTQPATGEPKPEIESQPKPEFQVEPETPPISRKKLKRDKKKKEISQSESNQSSESRTSRAQESVDGSESHAVVLESSSRDTEVMDPQDDGRASSGKKKSKKDKKRGKSLVEDTLSESQTIIDGPQNVAPPQQPSVNESLHEEGENLKTQNSSTTQVPIQPQDQPVITSDEAVEMSRNVIDALEASASAGFEQRPRTPPPDDQARIIVDMSPAQLSSHIEHDRPFDQSTQPDKKIRTRLVEDDTILTEPLSAIMPGPLAPISEVLNTQSRGAVAGDIPSVLEVPIEPEPMQVNDPQTSSKEKEIENPVLVHNDNRSALEESPIKKSDRKKKRKKGQVDEDQSAGTAIGAGVEVGVVELAEQLGEPKEVVAEKRSKHVEERKQNDDQTSVHKTPEESRLDTDPSVSRTEPSTWAEGQTSETPREVVSPAEDRKVVELTNLEYPDIVGTIVENTTSPGEVVSELSKPSTVDDAGTQKKHTSVVDAQDNLDRNTSEQMKTYHQSPLHAEARDAREESTLPLQPPPRTPSALDYPRSLPPVEEETREDLEKELRLGVENKIHTELEANRDSGFITSSPNPQRHSLDLDDAGQRDSGVHMRDWTAATPSNPGVKTVGSEESNTRIAPDVIDKDNNSSQTPQPHERRSRRSLFDNETPKLDTPTQGRGWERGNTPEKPAEDEPLKRTTTTPSTLRAAKYQELTSSRDASAALQGHTPQHQTPRSVSDNTSMHDVKRQSTPLMESAARRSTSNTGISRLRTPELAKFRTESPSSHSVHSVRSIRSLRSSGANTPPLLRRVDRRMSGDLRSLSHSSPTPSLHSSTSARNKDTDRDTAKDAAASSDRHALPSTITPIANEGRVRAKDMTDVYDGYGEGRIGSPRSPTRPPSMRRRQSMQVLELEARVEQLLAENRALADARTQAEQSLSYRNTSAITDRDAEIESLKASLQWLQNEVTRLTEVNEGLQSANSLLALQHNEKYTRLESQHTTATRELEEHRGAKDQFTQTIQAKDAEIQELRNQLEATKEQIREMKQQILATKPPDADFLRLKDEDHFDHRCQQLCSHVQQWVLRFSKFSDMRACRLTSEINDEKIIDRLDNTILDGSDVDDYLSDRVARRDIFMSMTMNMIWEFVFTRYLFGMDREQRQKLKSLEKILTDVGPTHAVRQWRAITLTLLSRRPAFGDQRNQDTEAVVQAILQTLSMILPPPSNLESQIQSQLRRVMREAVDLSIEMRTQRAEFMMLPPLQPEYDANGELTQTVTFNAALMHERSGDSSTTDEAYEAQGAVVRCVLFPLVVKKGDDNGIGDDEIVVSPAQVLVAKPRRSAIRMVTPSSDAGGASLLNYGAPSNISATMPDAPLTPEYT